MEQFFSETETGALPPSHMAISDYAYDKSNIIVFTTRLSPSLLEFWSDEFNFECSLRLLDDLKQQQKIADIKFHQQRHKALLTVLFTRYVINLVLGISNPFAPVSFTYNEYGKPLLPDFQFNSSSSNNIVCMVVEFSTHPIGVDLSHSKQKISNVNYLEEFRPIFDESEIPQVDTYFKFNHFWTLKEAFTKLLGSGLNIELAGFCFEVGEGFNAETYKYVGKQSQSGCYDYTLPWFQDVKVNVDKLKEKKNQFLESLEKEEFYCYSSILENGMGGDLPVIITIINQNKDKTVRPIEVQLERILNDYI
ncbi:L-aminoadipate-semialdehyde dehydrogenase-phosphopantetheinyl transferase [Candida viswanathii]|uniref:holo-[acyl-carrier-protein] synthase n=1 Tax=Candida viswanathii TaxID=5486 RepID=A0A367Y8M4_9ASCO|nr:L-aminoadipate-semialdehyde dehydrogenase-phosphopantetheinyl transferase [Candida viswanathii]